MTEIRTTPPRLRIHLVDRPNTHALVSGRLSSPKLELDFCGPASAPAGFRRMVRERAFDLSEMSLMTFLQARAYGKPLLLLPAVVLGRFQHRFLVCRREDPLRPGDLSGRRIAARSYSVTTVALLRAVLERQYGVAPETMRWICREEAHVAEYRDPPFVERIEADGRSLEDLLLDGTVDAAILGQETRHPALRTLIADPEAAARDWHARTGALQINHIVTVDAGVSARHPDAVRAFWHLLGAARLEAPQHEIGLDVLPFGLEANRNNLEFALDCAAKQGLTPRRLMLDELFDDNLYRLLAVE